MDHKEAADPFMVKWMALISAQSTLKPVVTAASGVKYPKHAKTFTYTLSDKTTTWWWTLDMDEACLETQTQPSTLAQFKMKGSEIRFIVDRDIFQTAQKIGLVPGGGGSHISIDAKTTFGGSGEQFLVLLQQMQSNFGAWDNYFKQKEKGDVLNAAWIGEMEGRQGQRVGSQLKPFLAETERLLNEVIDGKLDMSGAVQALITFNQTLKNPVAEKYKKGTEAQKKAGTAVAREPSHYQAVNIEHMSAHEDAKSQRLELRRICSQQDAAELVKQIEFIFALINQV